MPCLHCGADETGGLLATSAHPNHKGQCSCCRFLTVEAAALLFQSTLALTERTF